MPVTSPPNLLFVLTDQQTLRAMSCGGNPWLKTPAMDRLAAGGVRFEKSYCVSPVSGPSRASLVTGQMPGKHHLIYNHDARFADSDADRLPTIADHLRAVGYGAYWIGKWHAQEFYPNREERIHGFDFLPTGATGFHGLGLDMDAAVTDRAVEFLENPPTQPWFLGVAWHNPHDICYWVMEEYRNQLDPITSQGDLPPLPGNFEIAPDEPEFFKICRQRQNYGPEWKWTTKWDQTRWREYLRAYYRLTELIDAELGRLLDALDRTGLAENTLVVFTSDHGEACGGHQLVMKLLPWEPVVSVPLLARLPGTIPAGKVCRTHIASGVDLLPTFCDFAGAPAPAGAPGVSLRRVLENPEEQGRPFAVIHLDTDPKRPEVFARVVRTPDFKYIKFSIGEPAEALYNVNDDSGEMKNLVQEAEAQEQLLLHRQLLEDWESPCPGSL